MSLENMNIGPFLCGPYWHRGGDHPEVVLWDPISLSLQTLSEKVGLLCKHSFKTNPRTSFSSKQTAAPKILLYRNSGVALGSSELEPYRWVTERTEGY